MWNADQQKLIDEIKAKLDLARTYGAQTEKGRKAEAACTQALQSAEEHRKRSPDSTSKTSLTHAYLKIAKEHAQEALREAHQTTKPGTPERRRAQRELTAQELAAVKRFAKDQGPRWKEWLKKAWENGTLQKVAPADDVAALQAVRNKIGPSGLQAFKL